MLAENNEIDSNELIKAVSEFIVDDSIDKLIEECQIDLLETLTAPPTLIEVKDFFGMTPMMTKGNFSIVTGPPKSRKSYFVSMLMSTAINGNFQDYFKCKPNGINLLFDTEQSKYKVQETGKRICSISESNNPSNFQIYTLRAQEPDERLIIIERVLESTSNLNYVVIDGIVDLAIDPILQAEHAQKVVQKLMIWTERYNIHITCVLHYNKSASTLLGHIGSFGQRKADTVIEITKDKDNDKISIVKPLMCREKEFNQIAFSVDEYNNPTILVDYEFSNKKAFKQKIEKPIKINAYDKIVTDDFLQDRIVSMVFKAEKEQAYGDCWKRIKNIVGIEIIPIGDNKAKEILVFLKDRGKILTTDETRPKYFKGRQREMEV